MEKRPTPDKVQIRGARSADVPTLLALIRELAEYEHLADQVRATPGLLEESLFGESPAAQALIAEWEGETVGYAIFFHSFSTFLGRRGLYLEDLYVRPSFRNRGVGGKLLRRVARMAREGGCGRLEWAVLDWNRPAVRFYRALRAEPLEEWTVFRLAGGPLEELAGPPGKDGGP